MATVIAVANQKGGVGKSTISRELSAGFALRGYRTLAVDAENLTQLIKQFKTGEGMSARQTPREATAASHSRPSPARSLIGKVAGAFNGGSAAKAIAAPAGDNWEEF